MEWEAAMSPVPGEPRGSSFSIPSFTPDSLPVLLPTPGPTQSHLITVLGAEHAGLTEGSVFSIIFYHLPSHFH